MQLAAVDIPDRVRLHYVQDGKGDAVVLLHGGMGDCWSWPRQMAALAPRFRVIAYSRRYNFPNTNAIADSRYSCRIDANDLGHFLETLSCRSVHLVGTSYGALTALYWTLCRPEAVSSLTLVEPPILGWVTRFDGGHQAVQVFLRGVWRPAARSFRLGEPRAAMRQLCDGMRGAGVFDLMSEEDVNRIMRNSLAMERLVVSTEPFPEPSLSAARQLTMPILLMTGENTVPLHRLCYVAASQVLVEAQQAVIPRAGHAPANENPSAFNQTLADFLATV